MIEEFFKAPFFEKLKDALIKEHSLVIEELNDCGKALILTHLHARLKRNILVISQGNRESNLIDDLQFFGSKALEFPSWEALPEEGIEPSLDIVGRRLEVLESLKSLIDPFILIAPLQSVLQKVPAKDTIHKISFNRGEDFKFESVEELFKKLGYEKAKLVSDKGTYAIRGGIIDVFPVSEPSPFRMEFFGDTIDLIKRFDPMSQHSVETVTSFSLFPANESHLTATSTAYLLDYLGNDCLIVLDEAVAIEDAYVNLKKLIDSTHSKLHSFETFLETISKHLSLFFVEKPLETLSEVIKNDRVGRKFYTDPCTTQSLIFTLFDHTFSSHLIHPPLYSVADYFELQSQGLEGQQIELSKKLEGVNKFHVYFTASTELEEESMKRYFDLDKIGTYSSQRGYLTSSIVIEETKTVLLSQAEFFRRYKITRKKWRNTYHTPVSDYHQMDVGDYVVHFQSGVGKFLGIEKQKNHLGQDSEFLILEYAQNSKLFVPISQAHLVSRYIGIHEEKPELHTLGTAKWAKAKTLAQQAIIGYAKDLLQMQAERELSGGFVYPEDGLEMKAFEDEFPYQETDDQLKAIDELKMDMKSPKSMDRLLCGDVGYGKTEVAMRAAFKAVIDGKKQVAVLVPTTILAIQHYESFKARMESFGVIVDVVCRFKSTKEIKRTLEKLHTGSIDILIGTHRLLSQDVLFKDLGLIIIDEEQRFGVRAKEKLKKIKIGVDCLTMTATPIPRTLYFSLINAKEMSVINSPPHDRLPIRTIICDRDDTIIQQALLRELSRDGQAYFIHNRVETIFGEAEKIQKLLPQSKISVAHGQMDADSIDQAFHAFKQGTSDILVATSIVENGIDIANANTIIIDHAEQFGISDLYQLRGRVGRHNKPSYAYFMTPKFQRLQESTQKRLKALVESSGYGGGMKLAMLDLEIRGAGDILGTQQSGHVSSIGFHLYCKLLKKTMDAMKKKKPTTFLETKLEFPFIAKIPDYYIPDTSIRLEFYHRLGEATSGEEVDLIIDELKDRFGKIPVEAEWLKSLTKIKIKASEKGITLIKFEKLSLVIEKMHHQKQERKQFLMKEPKSPLELEKTIDGYLL